MASLAFQAIGLSLAACMPLLAADAQAQVKEYCDGPVCVVTSQKENRAGFRLENRSRLLPVTVALAFRLDNARFDGKATPVTVEPGSALELGSVVQRRVEKPWRYEFSYQWRNGAYLARHDDRIIYRLPWRRGETWTVTQSCNGDFSHTGKRNHALDAGMPEGTAILAARAGTVIHVREDSVSGGAGSRYADDANEILIAHDDGTLAAYLHLMPDGALVEPGDRVRAGDRIGYSGNTGWSTEPHLHFEVFTIDEALELRSLPVRFATSLGTLSCPPAGSRLSAE